MDLSVARFERALAGHRVSEVSHDLKRTAVAAVLRFDRGAPDVLLMKRAVREGDLWSGHISMPGGRESPADPDLLATAIRETREEVGVDLERTARLIGRLEPVQAVAQGKLRSLMIAPYVFVQTEPMVIELNYEAQAAFWLPLDRAVAGELSGTFEYHMGPQTRTLPCWHYEGHMIWGLTYRMLEDLIRVVTSA